MRLTLNNIKFVKEMTKNGTTYSWYVGMKSGYVSDGRSYGTDLPATVKKFIETHPREEFDKDDWRGDEYVHYIYR